MLMRTLPATTAMTSSGGNPTNDDASMIPVDSSGCCVSRFDHRSYVSRRLPLSSFFCSYADSVPRAPSTYQTTFPSV